MCLSLLSIKTVMQGRCVQLPSQLLTEGNIYLKLNSRLKIIRTIEHSCSVLLTWLQPDEIQMVSQLRFIKILKRIIISNE